MSGANGRRPTPPLTMSTPQRRAALEQLGLLPGWVLLSVAEMQDLSRSMKGATDENERLNKQTARLLAAQLVNQAVVSKALASARALLEVIANGASDSEVKAAAAREVAQIDQAADALPKPEGAS